MKDKNRFSKKSTFLSLFLFLIFQSLNAQTYNIDYYGIVSTEIDSNMSKMTSDLYYTQLSEINNFTVLDKRTSQNLTEAPDSNQFSEDTLSFYTIITKESSSDKWITNYCVIDKKRNEKHSKQKTFDSFYKILMEPKDTLKATIKQLIENTPDSLISDSKNHDMQFSGKKEAEISSTEELSGTWSGEDNINKIVIMRGGRGFVIFNNGASMNISVELSGADGKNVVVTQKGRSNASFYPELERTAALNAAVSAEPIKWTLTLIDSNTLKGTKDTLLPDGDSFKNGTVKVTWSKVN